jgi:hypothetical protein
MIGRLLRNAGVIGLNNNSCQYKGRDLRALEASTATPPVRKLPVREAYLRR